MAVQFDVVFDDRDLTGLMQRLEEQFSPKARQRLLTEWVEDLGRLDLLKVPYPPQSNKPLPKIYRWADGRLSKFKSLRAQRGFFAKLRSGEIKIPSRRTYQLQDAVDIQVAQRPDGAVLQITLREQNRRGKRFRAAWVIGSPLQQTYYFRNLTQWEPYETTIVKRLPRIEAVGAAILEAKVELVAR